MGRVVWRPDVSVAVAPASVQSFTAPIWMTYRQIIGDTSFSKSLKRAPLCALGIVDWDSMTGRLHHVGMRSRQVDAHTAGRE
jgi:hypothetical protein